MDLWRLRSLKVMGLTSHYLRILRLVLSPVRSKWIWLHSLFKRTDTSLSFRASNV